MKNKQIQIVIISLLFIIILGIGYAGVSNIGLKINSAPNVIVNSSNFNVHFNKNITPTVSSNNIVASIDDEDYTIAYFDVSDLVSMSDSATATYNIVNESNGIAAAVSLEIKNNNTEYFNVTKTIQKTNLLAGENTNVTISVTLNKVPVEDAVSSSISIKIKAEPIENDVTIYAYGDPDTVGIQTYTNYYDINKNVFISKRGNNKEICINKRGIITCMSNNYNDSYKMVQAIRGSNDEGTCAFGAESDCDDSFGDEDCEIINESSCNYNGLNCFMTSQNYVSCSDTSTNARCSINSNGIASCN